MQEEITATEASLARSRLRESLHQAGVWTGALLGLYIDGYCRKRGLSRTPAFFIGSGMLSSGLYLVNRANRLQFRRAVWVRYRDELDRDRLRVIDSGCVTVTETFRELDKLDIIKGGISPLARLRIGEIFCRQCGNLLSGMGTALTAISVSGF